MAGTQYVALLRGINVGGNNMIRMPQLKACFEEGGFENVSTYIQSGNVLFEAPKGKADALTRVVEKQLSDAFDLEISVVLRSRQQMTRVIADAPKGFGSDLARYRYDVIFLKEPLTAAQALKHVRTRDGVDTAAAGTGVLYFSRLTSKATQSYLNKIIGTPAYKRMTIRNWNTTTKILALMEGER
jgi:uncharacterized protein (DUF1697 family)